MAGEHRITYSNNSREIPFPEVIILLPRKLNSNVLLRTGCSCYPWEELLILGLTIFLVDVLSGI